MFTGIITDLGQVTQIEPYDSDKRFHIQLGQLSVQALNLGDSIAVNGVCLTVVDITETGFWADVSGETLAVTTLNDWQVDQAVNLEPALTPKAQLGGHIVSGHVDGIGQVQQRFADGRSERFIFQLPVGLGRYVAKKGSICIDGTSLTVNAVDETTFAVNIVPHTLQYTIMGSYQAGTTVNLEVDLIARYLERLLEARQ